MSEFDNYELGSVPEIIIPGSFVVFQGVAGDGVANTIDSCPDLQRNEETEFGEIDDDNTEDDDFHYLNEDDEVVTYEASTTIEHPNIYNNPTALFPSLSTLSVQPLQTTTSGQRINRNDTFIFIAETREEQQQRQLPQTSQTTPQQDASCDRELIDYWNVQRCKRQQQDRKDWIENYNSNRFKSTDVIAENRWWINSDGRLKVFSDLPKRSEISGLVDYQVIGTLSPGATVVATRIFCLDTVTFKAIRMITNPKTGNFLAGRIGWLQILKIESPLEGMTVLSRDGYSYLGPGLPALYLEPLTWFWRVTCGSGAVLREGIGLENKQLARISYGSIVQVAQKMINREGLSRIQVYAAVKRKDNVVQKDPPQKGWISEYLNPESGQRGSIVQPLPFPVPALYMVIIATGITIRQDVELTSVIIGHAPMGATLSIIGRAFSEFSVNNCCIERLQLAGKGGWISVFDFESSENEQTVELIGIDGSFDPDSPGKFHLAAQRAVLQEQTNSSDPTSGDLSEIGSSCSSSDENYSLVENRAKANKVTRQRPPPVRKTEECLICLTESRNATIIHGETGHICCCLTCARILLSNGERCPVCRFPIEKVIQHFYA